MFGVQYTRSERLGGIAGKDGHLCLSEDRSLIVLFGDKMHRGAGSRVAAVQHSPVNVCAVHSRSAVFRQQSRVNVDDPAPPPLYDFGRHPLEKSGEYDEACIDRVQHPHPFGGIGDIFEHVSRHAGPARQLESAGLGSIAQHQHHLRRVVRSKRAEEGLQIAPITRYHGRHAQAHSTPI